MTELAVTGPRPGGPQTRRHEELLGRVHLGPFDGLGMAEVLALLPSHPGWRIGNGIDVARIGGATAILTWLSTHDGDGWQERWRRAGVDQSRDWIDTLIAGYGVKRTAVTGGLRALILSRVVLPDYPFFAQFQNDHFVADVVKSRGAAAFAEMDTIAERLQMTRDQYVHARSVVTRISVHTGRDVDQLVADDLYEYRASFLARFMHSPPGVHGAWDLLREIGVLPAGSNLRERLRRAQKTTEDLVDWYQLSCRPIRDVLVRYLSERRTSVDYSTFRGLTSALGGKFWADIERHHPGIDTLHLPDDVVQAWKERLDTVSTVDGNRRVRANRFDVMIRVRAFYLDIQEWSADDPSWIPWAVPSPVRKGDTDGKIKRRLATTARIHQRIRERLPLLPDLVAASEQHRTTAEAMLDAATGTPIGTEFDYKDRRYRRIAPTVGSGGKTGRDCIVVIDQSTSQRIDLTVAEEDAFWSWAIIETLRHSGLRIEELLELTHLALVSYTLPNTGEVVPLLQIVPSKGDEERLLLVSPELASTLATILTRLRRRNGGSVPLVARYDGHEGTTGPALPHLFQRRNGSQPAVMSFAFVRKVITRTLDRADLRDAAGQPLRYTPHDFRRMFATEAVGSGLPVHIAAKLLGHRNINTTQAYVAVFQDELIRTYRTFLDQRRALRPAAEYREPTDQEWQEFQQHFELRKVSLGTCARPYGTPCRHEHACVRCPVLRVDPRQRNRLAEIARNLTDRIEEAKQNGWLGEAQGLQISLKAAQDKLLSLDRAGSAGGGGGVPTNLGIPAIRA